MRSLASFSFNLSVSSSVNGPNFGNLAWDASFSYLSRASCRRLLGEGRVVTAGRKEKNGWNCIPFQARTSTALAFRQYFWPTLGEVVFGSEVCTAHTCITSDSKKTAFVSLNRCDPSAEQLVIFRKSMKTQAWTFISSISACRNTIVIVSWHTAFLSEPSALLASGQATGRRTVKLKELHVISESHRNP